MLSDDFILLRRLRLKIDLIPGPPHNDKLLYSQAIQVIARYPAATVAAAIHRIPCISLVTDGSRDPRAWQWLWRDGERSMRIGFSILGKEVDANTAWGGSSLDAECYVGDLLILYGQLRKTHPDIWLHYDGRVYTDDTFMERLRKMIEEEIITDIT